MPTWSDIEQRFRTLENSLQYTRLDMFKCGSAHESWRLAGPFSANAERQFRAIACIAGRKLPTVASPSDNKWAQILAEQDPTLRWYGALRDLGRGLERVALGHSLDDQGEVVDALVSGSISAPASASATLCLELAAAYPEESRTSQTNPAIIIESLGNHARVNVNSTDNSSNTVVTDYSKTFLELRETVTQTVPNPDGELILRAINEMEKAAGTKQFTNCYQEFIAAAAAHVAVIAPFLPFLANLIK